MQHERVSPVRAITSTLTFDAASAARASADFWQKWQETVSDAAETWLEAAQSKGPANLWSAQVEFGMRNAQRWYGWAPSAPVKAAETPAGRVVHPAETVVEATYELVENAPVAEPAAAASGATDEAATADDLQRIRGIGPAIERKLNDQGVFTYAQIASMSEADIEKLDAALDFRGRIERDGWVEQAGKLALRPDAN